MATFEKYMRKNGSVAWKFRTYAGIDPDTGKKIFFQKRGLHSKKEAQLVCTRMLTDFEKNGYKKKSANTFEDVYTLWLETYRITVKESSFVKLKQKFDTHILPALGELPINKIKPANVQRFANYMCFEMANKHYKEYISNVSRIFEYAIRQGIIQQNPVKRITLPKRKADLNSGSLRYFTQEQLKTFLDDTKKNESPKIFTFFYLLANSGCRQGEALALQWDCIDFEGKSLTIRQTLTRGENRRLYLEEPKTKKSKRSIPLNDATIKVLKEWRLRQRSDWLQVGINTMNAKQFVFTTIENDFIQLSHPRLWMHRICKRAELPALSPHALRHTFATILIAQGVNFKTVSALLGHSTVSMTLDIYAGVYEADKVETIDLLANVLK